MFNPDFYPTPPEVAAEMLDPLGLRGRVVLEPSAGSGNLVPTDFSIQSTICTHDPRPDCHP